MTGLGIRPKVRIPLDADLDLPARRNVSYLRNGSRHAPVVVDTSDHHWLRLVPNDRHEFRMVRRPERFRCDEIVRTDDYDGRESARREVEQPTRRRVVDGARATACDNHRSVHGILRATSARCDRHVLVCRWSRDSGESDDSARRRDGSRAHGH